MLSIASFYYVGVEYLCVCVWGGGPTAVQCLFETLIAQSGWLGLPHFVQAKVHRCAIHFVNVLFKLCHGVC